MIRELERHHLLERGDGCRTGRSTVTDTGLRLILLTACTEPYSDTGKSLTHRHRSSDPGRQSSESETHAASQLGPAWRWLARPFEKKGGKYLPHFYICPFSSRTARLTNRDARPAQAVTRMLASLRLSAGRARPVEAARAAGST